MTLTQEVTKNIITRLLHGQDYRIEIVALINAEFLQFAIDFFKKVATAKLDNKEIDGDWYKKTFLDAKLSADEIAIHSGLNKKTITNMFNSATKEIVLDASNEHYEILYTSISQLIEAQNDIDLTLTIKMGKVSVDLNINESLIVINTLAVKRAALRGGLWSTAGKRVEKPLMQTLCYLYQIPASNFAIQYKKSAKKADADAEGFEREIDFYFQKDDQLFKCEVKLMGKGNPESADAVIARDSAIFVADTLSDTNKKQLNSLNIEWLELRAERGYTKFEAILTKLGIPHQPFDGNLSDALPTAFANIFN